MFFNMTVEKQECDTPGTAMPAADVLAPPSEVTDDAATPDVVDQAAQLTQSQYNDRKRLQMQFLRSRTGKAGAFEKGDTSKCPNELKSKIPRKGPQE